MLLAESIILSPRLVLGFDNLELLVDKAALILETHVPLLAVCAAHYLTESAPPLPKSLNQTDSGLLAAVYTPKTECQALS